MRRKWQVLRLVVVRRRRMIECEPVPMPTTTAIPTDADIPPTGVVYDDVSWESYERFLEELGERRMPHSLVDGKLTLMAPSVRHESPKEWITRLVAALAEVLE